ncbi:DJ-1/PfpI family protein [Clostridium sp.]|uniref:DJ-1/PfpI family protein n=1 Tax=Clostridium sp. TaxID=1506 RepID=UPI003216B93C
MKNIKNEVLIVLTEQWNDWEASYAIAVINSFSDYKVKTIGVDKLPKKSMGGINASIDCTINDYKDFDKTAMVILPGGLSWEESDYNNIAEFVKRIMELHIPIAAICGAATFLCKHGFLDNINHTGDSLELFKQQKEYRGESFYINQQVVVANEVITANETAAVQFAYEIFKILGIDSDEEIEQWYDNFKNGAIR